LAGRFPVGVAILACASLAAAAPARAAVTSAIDFDQNGDGTASVFAQDIDGPINGQHHLDLVRNGALVATSGVVRSSFMSIDVASLQPNDVARLFDGSTVQASFTYDGQPTIGADACAGRLTFTGTRSASQTTEDAGAYTGSFYGTQNHAAFGDGSSFTVTLSRPLALGDFAFVVTDGLANSGSLSVGQYREVKVGACPASPPAPSPAKPLIAPQGPTDAQVAAALKASLASTARSLKRLKLRTLAKKTRFALPFTVPAAGTLDVTLTAKGVTIARGSKKITQAGKVKVTLKLTSKGRKQLRRSHRLTLTLKEKLSRPGKAALSASITAALKR
jgi:hypothetical protein